MAMRTPPVSIVANIGTTHLLNAERAVLQCPLVRVVSGHDQGSAVNWLFGAQSSLVSWWFAGLGRSQADHTQSIRQSTTFKEKEDEY